MTGEEAKRILYRAVNLVDASHREAFDEAIEALEQKQGWIPVSERLPEGLMVKTLVSCEDNNGLPISTMVALYDAFSKTWDCEYKVIAWMPLPLSYKASPTGDRK